MIFVSGSVPRRAIFSPRETSPHHTQTGAGVDLAAIGRVVASAAAGDEGGAAGKGDPSPYPDAVADTPLPLLAVEVVDFICKHL